MPGWATKFMQATTNPPRRRLPALLTAAAFAAFPAAAMAGQHGDFNADGYDDIAIGVPGEDVSGKDGAGAVSVIYGSATRLTATGNKLFHQAKGNIKGDPKAAAAYGCALAVGDFDDDGFDDLAIGIRGAKVGSHGRAGAVNVLYGSASGLTSAGNQLWTLDKPGVPEAAKSNDEFGSALAAGDFDGDGVEDLAVGAPRKKVLAADLAGEAFVIYGTSHGLKSTGAQAFSQSTPGIVDTSEGGDKFGSALASGRFDGDQFDDLAIGVPQERISANQQGAVNIIYGTGTGLVSPGNELLSQEGNYEGVPELNDAFGSALASGKFNDDTYDDLAIGVPGEEVNGDAGAGAVNVIPGSGSGFDDTTDQIWHQDVTNVEGDADPADGFGSALAAGRFDNNAQDDLAIGVPGEKVSTQISAGAVNVLYSSASGLTATGDEMFTQDTAGVGDTAEPADRFGSALAAGDFNGATGADLVVGVPDESLTLNSEGAIQALYGNGSGLDGANSQEFSQNTIGIKNSPGSFDNFGDALGQANN